MTEWPKVKLAEVLRRSADTIALDPKLEYKEITVRLWGKGVVERGRVLGTESSGGRRFLAHAGQLILSRIDARNGALGLVPPSLDGAVVSNDFPLFDINRDRVVPEFLGWLVQTRAFVELCLHASEGTTNRVRLQERLFLFLEIPLPPLPEQQRVVARIEDVAGQVGEARQLGLGIDEAVEGLLSAEERRVWPEEFLVDAPALGDVSVFLARGRQSTQGDSSHFLIKTQHVQQGRFVPTRFRLAEHVAAKVSGEALVRDGDILIACSAAGCLGRVAQYRGSGQVVSTDTHVAIARANPALVEPAYLYAYLRGAQGQHQLRSRERGDWMREKIGFRLTELNLNDLRKIPVPLPSRAEQLRIIDEVESLRSEIARVRELRLAAAGALDALLPAVLDLAFRGDLA